MARSQIKAPPPTRTSPKTVQLMIRVRLADGARRFVRPAMSANGKLRPLYALVNGQPELHPEGVYALRYVRDGARTYETVGADPQVAMTAKLRVEHCLQAASLGLTPAPEHAGPPRTDLAQAIETYLGDTAALKAKKTWHAYSLTLTGFLKVCPQRYLDEVTRKDILVFIAHLKSVGNAPRTVSNRLDFLKIFFHHFAVTWPLQKTDRVKYTEKIVSAYSFEEVGSLLAVADQDEADLILFFLQTGAREQEVQYACWSDIDLTAKTFTVREKLDLGFTPKDKEEGSVPIPDHLVDILKARRKRVPEGRLIFAGGDGNVNGHFLRIVKRLALVAGVNCGECYNRAGTCCAKHPVCRKVGLHRFRKTFATKHHEAGVPARTIQAWLRHSSLDTTLRYLAHSENTSDKMREKVNSTFAGIGKKVGGTDDQR